MRALCPAAQWTGEETACGRKPGRAELQRGRAFVQHSRGSAGLPPAGLTVSGHAQCQAFLQAAVLASVPARAVDGTVLLTGAGVGHVTILAPAEEALAPLAGDDPVVDPRRLVPADFARDHFNL